MRYFCPKCLSVCNNKQAKNIFIELKCQACGHSWLDRREDNKPMHVVGADLVNVGVDND